MHCGPLAPAADSAHICGEVMDAITTPREFLDRLASHGDAAALMVVRGDRLETTGFRTIVEQAQRLARGLRAAGIETGAFVALYGPNRPEWVIARFAIAAAGAVAVAVDDMLPEREVLPFLRDSGAKHLFTTEAHAGALREHFAPAELTFHLLDRDEATPLGQSWRALLSDEAADLPDLAPEAPAMVVYTSGTTGTPKSFLLSYANLANNVNAIAAANLVGPDDRALLPLPLDNVYPYVVGLLTPLAAGTAVVFPEEITGPAVVHALGLSKATAMVGVPRLYAAMVAGIRTRVAARGRLPAWIFDRLLALSIALQRRFGFRPGRRLFAALHRQIDPELRLLACGGARLEPSLVWSLEGLGWEVRGGYGLAEVGSVFSANFPGQKLIGSEGKPIHDGRIRIDRPEADGIGEIQLKGRSVFAGYRNNPEANAMAFTEDGWFRTGDLGYQDAEGHLYITGRAKEMIVLGGGKNVFPEELEKLYVESPYVTEIALLERAGDLVGLIVPDLAAVKESGYRRIEDALRVSLAEVSRPLPGFQRLSGFAIARAPLPRTRLGKYRRFLLPDLYEAAQAGTPRQAPAELSPEDRALLTNPLAEQLLQLFKERYPDKPVGLDASPQLDLGIDSLEWVGLTLELEQRFGIALSDDDIADLDSLRDVVAIALRQAEQGARPAPKPTVDLDTANWLKPPGTALVALGRLLHGINWVSMRILFRLRREGEAALPRDGPCLLVANHVSDLDPLALAAALPPHLRHRVYWGGDAVRLFGGPLAASLGRALHVFPVDERAPAASLAGAAEVLRRGQALAWFPESWRSPDGELQRFFPGVGRLAGAFEGTVVPVFIDGTFAAMPRWRRLPRLHPLRVVFGTPVTSGELAPGAGGQRDPDAITEDLHERLAALIRQSRARP